MGFVDHKDALAAKGFEMEISVLIKVWQEDEVWNASGFDIPVVVFGGTLDEALANFEEAIRAHFEVLDQLGKVGSVIIRLQQAEADRELAMKRLTSLPEGEFLKRVIVPHDAQSSCAAFAGA